MKPETAPRFTFEQVKYFNRDVVEQSLETQHRLYIVGYSRVNELKADVCHYILSILDDTDNTYFAVWQAKINTRLNELIELGCGPAVDRFFEYGHWT